MSGRRVSRMETKRKTSLALARRGGRKERQGLKNHEAL